MTGDASPSSSADRLDSWKEIAAYLGKGVRTVQRWESTGGLPIYRVGLDRPGSVYAYRSELDAWWRQHNTRSSPPPPGPESAPCEEIELATQPTASRNGTANPDVQPEPMQTGVPVLGGLSPEPAAETLLRSAAENIIRPPKARWEWVLVVGATILLASLSVLRWKIPQPASEPVIPKLTPLTSNVGFEFQPAFSADGRQVAYVAADAVSPGYIFVKPADADSGVRLTNGAAAERCPAWSPNGRTIAFLRCRARVCSLVLIPAGGGPEARIAEGPAWTRLLWSPDGEWLLTSQFEDRSNSIVAISATSGVRHALTGPMPFPNRGFGLSPDGARLIYATGGPGKSSLLNQTLGRDLRPRGSPRTLIAGMWLREMVLTPDGKEIVYADGSEEEGVRLWHRELAANSVPRLILGSQNTYGNLTLSSGAARLAFTVYPPSRAEAWKLPLGVARANAVPVIVSTHSEQNPDYSPDGGRIAFHSTRTGASEIWIANRDGSAGRRLTHTNARTTATPRWSPDGAWIAYESNESGQSEVYVIRSNGGPARRLTHHPNTDAIPSWSRDGQSIYFCSDRTGRFEIWRIGVSGGAPTQVTRDGGFAAVESADGNYLYYTQTRDAGPLFRVPVTGRGVPQEPPRLIAQETHGLFFAVAPNGVYYNFRGVIYFWNLADGISREVLRPNSPLGIGLAVSADGAELLYTKLHRADSDLYMIDGWRR
ncbi:MAG: PD40 domain-containing protein [Bryobacterales bacterium]|nr:PD40 domain-containing protein [Bryobacterales bacterium]